MVQALAIVWTSMVLLWSGCGEATSHPNDDVTDGVADTGSFDEGSSEDTHDVETPDGGCGDSSQCHPGLVWRDAVCQPCSTDGDCTSRGYLSTARCNVDRGVCLDSCSQDSDCDSGIHGTRCLYRDDGDATRSCVTECGVTRPSGALAPDHTLCEPADAKADPDAALPMCLQSDRRNKAFSCTYQFGGRACPDLSDGPTNNGWQRRILRDGEARCNNGCPYVYYYRTSPNAVGSDKWVILFQGGGGCSSDAACASRWATNRSLMVPDYDMSPTQGANDATTPSPDTDGIFARGRSDNYFTDWNQVYLPYCSSDAHAGVAHREDNGIGAELHGHYNALETISDVVARPLLTPMIDASDVLISGISAGAAGARANADLFAAVIRGAASGTPTIKGVYDAAFRPSMLPSDFERQLAALAAAYRLGSGDDLSEIYDTSCIDAHSDPDDPHSAYVLCSDPWHALTGKGNADITHSGGTPTGETDEGHLSTHSDGDEAAVDAVFAFMDQYDTKSLEGVARNMCVRDECADRDDCQAYGSDYECKLGLCMRRATAGCAPAVCTMEDLVAGAEGSASCYGPGNPTNKAYCLYEQGVYDHPAAAIAPASSSRCVQDTDCASGEQCTTGICRLMDAGCKDDSDCASYGNAAGEYTCELAVGVCVKLEVADPSDCNESAAVHVPDADECRILPGCSPAVAGSCPSGYTCMDHRETPVGQAHAYVIRERFAALDALSWTDGSDPSKRLRAIGFSPGVVGHTAIAGLRFFKTKIHGVRVADALQAWYTESPTAQTLVAPSPTMGWPLRVDSAVSGAIELGFAPQVTKEPASCAPIVQWGVLTADEDTPLGRWTMFVDGTPPQEELGSAVSAERIKLVVSLAPESDCDGVVIDTTIPTESGGQYIRIGLSAGGQTAPIPIGLPDTVVVQDGAPFVVHIADDGSTWNAPDMVASQQAGLAPQ